MLAAPIVTKPTDQVMRMNNIQRLKKVPTFATKYHINDFPEKEKRMESYASNKEIDLYNIIMSILRIQRHV